MTDTEKILASFEKQLSSKDTYKDVSFRRTWIFLIPASIILLWYGYTQYYGHRMLAFGSEERHHGSGQYYHK